MSKKEDFRDKEKDIFRTDEPAPSKEHGLMIKIDSHLDRVTADINNYTNLLGSLERKLFLNSVLSYIIFLILVIGLSYLVFKERNRSLVNENALLKTTISQNSAKITELNDRISGYKTTTQKTETLLEEFSNTTSDPKKLVDDYEALDKQFFSKVEISFFQEKINKLKLDLSVRFYENGKNFFESNAYSKAVSEFTESLKYNPKNPYINEINFFMGISYLRMKKYSECIPYLEKAMVNNFDRNKADDILFYLGNAYEHLSNNIKAKEYYKKIIEQYSTGDKYWEAKKRWAQIEKK
ncbi:hypothetical protein JXR93_12770 [bacterium]|nr:hypothetical protein [bacterium]